ncbi:MAG: LacI family DNA-binding transcriptional regulator [Gemmatimonadaceae bacterium]
MRSSSATTNPESLKLSVWSKSETMRNCRVLCANDRTAGRLLHTLRRLGVHVPDDVRLVGIDDVEYAKLLPVPLTTLRQPTQQLGEVAMGVMLERVARRDLPARDTRLRCELVVRESCGASTMASIARP